MRRFVKTTVKLSMALVICGNCFTLNSNAEQNYPPYSPKPYYYEPHTQYPSYSEPPKQAGITASPKSPDSVPVPIISTQAENHNSFSAPIIPQQNYMNNYPKTVESIKSINPTSSPKPTTNPVNIDSPQATATPKSDTSKEISSTTPAATSVVTPKPTINASVPQYVPPMHSYIPSIPYYAPTMPYYAPTMPNYAPPIPVTTAAPIPTYYSAPKVPAAYPTISIDKKITPGVSSVPTSGQTPSKGASDSTHTVYPYIPNNTFIPHIDGYGQGPVYYMPPIPSITFSPSPTKKPSPSNQPNPTSMIDQTRATATVVPTAPFKKPTDVPAATPSIFAVPSTIKQSNAVSTKSHESSADIAKKTKQGITEKYKQSIEILNKINDKGPTPVSPSGYKEKNTGSKAGTISATPTGARDPIAQEFENNNAKLASLKQKTQSKIMNEYTKVKKLMDRINDNSKLSESAKETQILKIEYNFNKSLEEITNSAFTEARVITSDLNSKIIDLYSRL